MLRAEDQRVTGARLAVIHTLAELGGHPSADQVCERLQETYPTVHRATIYRTLDTLAGLGIVRQVNVGGAAAAYHLATSPAGDRHLHARCEVCGRIIDLPGDLLDPVVERLGRDGTFRLDPAHVALAGTCPDCVAAGAGGGPGAR